MSDTENWLNNAEVRSRYKISAATLNRWDRDDDLGFPKPMVINRRKLYPLSQLRNWERSQASASRRRAA
ncbi:DNA-binding protein [Methylobacterium sp. Leaf118]|uniref:DNA-binding protein n=1 Tax=Methylobacterium sp. Leaf118 TaxID=2876562 RepID=UPI001E554E24|nr:DNA-binding protein [Methylobacterium sp. Leaf118]